MRKLTPIVALATVAVIVGLVGSKHHAATEAGNQKLPLAWDAESRRVLARACTDCHSDHTDWPWYSNVAPSSWWIARHIHEGRQNLDFSKWEQYSAEQRRDKLESICGVIATGRMPPELYNLMHPGARVTEKDKDTVCHWVKTETTRAR
jgi:Haem-binding domain